ncbi:general glycosylation pathway protein [Pseudoalteromonas sp. MMG006]|uniref:EAL-associated domain-containing protein n=1 Tax=Pseudoalteromonas TaxID=53246 RepID=UPI00110AEB9C|nr:MULTISPECIES: EAL-associated domain-containing protein [unclassified Pseudoalteromonas]MBQ4798238.1 general glycosylation pathway protein [Pseudoalteromonas sp. MMG006]MBQ4857944.1 general glycosylation pathway protein [Pseudoalteromonas sp. MMG007]TMP02780.1 general glycosylation pathway protein [Pseudoalteromonas sp. S3178]|tara:strand:+ start:420 stop:1367 length:948 start_codon:yes stop_codon:yes gene_type:complete
MARMSYISSVERYHEYEHVIHSLLESILMSIEDGLTKERDTRYLVKQYPFLELQYCLNEQGLQQGNNVCFKRAYAKKLGTSGNQQDLSERPYFLQSKANDAVCFTDPYISIATHHLCISAIKELKKPINNQHYLVVDVSLTQLIEFIMGDTARANMSPYFKAGYGVIVACLFGLVLFLLNIVFSDIYALLTHVDTSSDPLEPFSIIIYITLALAVFDLGKTILEEEILMHKDIFRHSSTRRTITRFISTVLIAISIEALLTMFKAALGQAEYLMPAIAMMLAVVGLLIALAIYVYLGAKAETLLMRARLKQKSSK